MTYLICLRFPIISRSHRVVNVLIFLSSVVLVLFFLKPPAGLVIFDPKEGQKF